MWLINNFYNFNMISRKKQTNKVQLSKTIITSDFSDYKSLGSDNRKVNIAHVAKLVQSFKDFGTSTSRVIVVETKSFLDSNKRKNELYVADGQHSIAAVEIINATRKDDEVPLTLNVMVVKLLNDTQPELKRYISALNNNSKSWTTFDYVGSFASAGIYEYVKFDTLLATHKKIKITITDLQMVYLHGAGPSQVNDFRSGIMRFSNEADSDLLFSEYLKLIPDFPKAFIRRNIFKFLHANGTSNFQTIVDQLRFSPKGWSSEETDFQNELLKRIKIKNMINPFVSRTKLRKKINPTTDSNLIGDNLVSAS